MRSADASTIFRIGLVLFVIFLAAVKFNPAVSITLLALAFVLDGVDGYLALREASGGRLGLSEYADYAISGANAKRVRALKEKTAKIARYGPRLDVAGDRIAEYSFWGAFAVFGIVPLFVLIIIIIRHSIADALLAAKGTSSRMRTGFARMLYSSNVSRGAVNALKFVTFSYFILAYVSGFPMVFAYVLMSVLVIFIVARGAAEVYESTGK